MSSQAHGELVPIGGGDPIPLTREKLKLGRRESCDICLRFPNVSGQHCELAFINGLWQLTDLGSTNGTKVNGARVQKKLLRPGDEISIAKRRYTIQYSLPMMTDMSAFEDTADHDEPVMGKSLLERAGLVRRRDDDEDDDD